MNNLIQLKGKFEQASRQAGGGKAKLPKAGYIEYNKVIRLISRLNKIKEFWKEEDLLSKVLINICYNKLVAKSNRVKEIFSGTEPSTDYYIVGAKFSDDKSPKHIITYYISYDILDNTVKELLCSAEIIKNNFNEQIDNTNFDDIDKINIDFDNKPLSKSEFKQILVDMCFIDDFKIPETKEDIKYESIVSIYKTDYTAKDILEKIGIDLMPNKILDETTVLLTPKEFDLLRERASYLIAKSVIDVSKFTIEDFPKINKTETLSIPDPKNEPVIGVIDTAFDKRVYFSKWVEYHDCLKKIEKEDEDFEHGTKVSSIIVDGPSFNKNLDDGCGRFRVRHFCVATAKQFSSFSILKRIQDIVVKNKDIKVWNLSLGSNLEINKNSISPEAAILDQIQYDNDVIFVISGTNKYSDDIKSIGSPADSINSLVVNSVKLNNIPASYTRTGPVLSFFVKPDISYYGGDKKEEITVCSPNGNAFVSGTSFAAPWIARKMAYLIHVLGLSREVSKALIIHSATGWEKLNKQEILSKGYGVVPIRIEDVINSKDDEIKFIISGVSEKYDTYAYNIPIPKDKEKHPFIANATLCYFPACSKNQGVDYTNTELDIHFGQIYNKDGRTKINSINSNFQNDEDEFGLFEKDARLMFRKWDNVKHISDVLKKTNRGKKVYSDMGFWGISLKTTERLDKKYGAGLKFGIVVTLKEINGVNRIDSFIKSCISCGWLINRIDIENKIDVYNAAQEEVTFDEDVNE